VQLSELENKKVAIWGYGREGRAAYYALREKFFEQALTVLCSEAEASQLGEIGDSRLVIVTDEVTAELLARFDVVIKSPGISPYGHRCPMPGRAA
jgi:UDP-N-acetylmuramoylalanine-D-glutamate ligase